MPMTIVLGCDHCLQCPEHTSGFWRDIEQTAKARRQREGFRTTIEEIIRDHQCTFIGEETNHGQITPALLLSRRLGLTYQNIDMEPEERAAMGIPAEGYDDNPRYSHEQKQAWNHIREQHMIEEIEAARGDSENLLIICGVRHMVPLHEYFRGQGEDATSIDVTCASWFAGPLSSEWLYEA